MRRNKDFVILGHIIEYCDDVAETITRFAGSKETFMNDRIFRNACAMPLMQIGELAKNLSDDVSDIDKTIPWKEIKGMRDYFAHEYHEMDMEIIWSTIEDLPVFKSQCEKVRKQLAR